MLLWTTRRPPVEEPGDYMWMAYRCVTTRCGVTVGRHGAGRKRLGHPPVAPWANVAATCTDVPTRRDTCLADYSSWPAMAAPAGRGRSSQRVGGTSGGRPSGHPDVLCAGTVRRADRRCGVVGDGDGNPANTRTRRRPTRGHAGESAVSAKATHPGRCGTAGGEARDGVRDGGVRSGASAGRGAGFIRRGAAQGSFGAARLGFARLGVG
jgi:hypothetical protein